MKTTGEQQRSGISRYPRSDQWRARVAARAYHSGVASSGHRERKAGIHNATATQIRTYQQVSFSFCPTRVPSERRVRHQDLDISVQYE
jgi:hypothetical protein